MADGYTMFQSVAFAIVSAAAAADRSGRRCGGGGRCCKSSDLALDGGTCDGCDGNRAGSDGASLGNNASADCSCSMSRAGGCDSVSLIDGGGVALAVVREAARLRALGTYLRSRLDHAELIRQINAIVATASAASAAVASTDDSASAAAATLAYAIADGHACSGGRSDRPQPAAACGGSGRAASAVAAGERERGGRGPRGRIGAFLAATLRPVRLADWSTRGEPESQIFATGVALASG